MSSAGSSSGVVAATDVQALSSSAKLQLLRDLMQRPARHPSQVLICATHVLTHGGAASEAERFAFMEMAAIAAIDLGRDAQATEHIRNLTRRFGTTSTRVRRLLGLQMEAAGKTDSAMQLYTHILKDHPTEQWCVRRLCAMHRGRGDYKMAIETLKQREVFVDAKENKSFTYAQLFPADEAAARELISLNWLLNNVSECIRYADEIVLFDPANYSHHTRLAELCYAAGQYERSATAYAQSLRLNDGRNNARAFYGLWLVASQLVKAKNSKHASNDNMADASELLEFAATKLRSLYAGSKAASYLDLTLKVQ